jgi:acetyl esterase/lipase
MALTANDPEYQPGFEDADTTLQAAVPFYGVYDFTNRQGGMHEKFLAMFLEPWVMKASFADEPDKFHRASPIDCVHADAPPFLAIHGDRDTLAPVIDARLFVERLREVSQEPVLYAELRGAQHAFEIFGSVRAVACVEAAERFLQWAHERHLGTVPAEPATAVPSDLNEPHGSATPAPATASLGVEN